MCRCQGLQVCDEFFHCGLCIAIAYGHYKEHSSLSTPQHQLTTLVQGTTTVTTPTHHPTPLSQNIIYSLHHFLQQSCVHHPLTIAIFTFEFSQCHGGISVLHAAHFSGRHKMRWGDSVLAGLQLVSSM